MKIIRTQKARGVQHLAHVHQGVVPPTAYWTASAEEPPIHGYPAFARPCPTTPRHGFVDSRVVAGVDEARQVYAEALAADPGAELMLMPLIDAHRSAVVTPTWAAIGNGHDGATAGKAGTLAAQLLHVAIPIAPVELIPHDQIPYLEVVYGTYTKQDKYRTAPYASRCAPWLVQLRSGPSIGEQGAGNYIPRDTIVGRVIDAHELDALALEATLNEADAAGALAGLIIWQANGNPCSHAACHARLHSIPIVFDDVAPTAGTTLTHTEGSAAPMLEDVMGEAVREYGHRAYHLSGAMPASILWAVHQAPALARSVEGARFVAQACVNLWRYAATACCGESRHSRFINGRVRRRSRARARHSIYSKALTKAAADTYLRTRCSYALTAFSLADNFSSGYGGSTWEGCARAALALYDALAALSAGAAGAASDVILAAHAVVNSAHNNGPFLNKFIESHAFESAAHGELFQTLNGLEELHAHAEARAQSISHTEGKVWAKRKHVKPAVLSTRAQWNLRSNGTAIHVQVATSGKRKDGSVPYLSATVSLGLLDWTQLCAIAWHCSFIAPTLKSFASDSRYWDASGVITQETMRALFPNNSIKVN